MLNSKLKLLICLITSLSILASPAAIHAQPQAIVNVTTSVQACLLDIVVRPEARVPAINNWDSIVDITILRNDNTLLAAFTLNTNIQGLGTYDFCLNGIFPTPGTYKFYAKGISHLRKRFLGVSTFNAYHDLVNLTGASNFLIAGEVSNVIDNKINSLDMSYVQNKIATTDYKADLNQDGIVSSLDTTIVQNNYFKVGDPMP
ncbi:MAG: dockerin type I domain-containing protein [Candidatus Dojkabacteria bacterium]